LISNNTITNINAYEDDDDDDDMVDIENSGDEDWACTIILHYSEKRKVSLLVLLDLTSGFDTIAHKSQRHPLTTFILFYLNIYLQSLKYNTVDI